MRPPDLHLYGGPSVLKPFLFPRLDRELPGGAGAGHLPGGGGERGVHGARGLRGRRHRCRRRNQQGHDQVSRRQLPVV